MRKFKTFEEFASEHVVEGFTPVEPALNEGLFDFFKNLFSKFTKMFTDSATAQAKVNKAIEQLGDKAKGKYDPKATKSGETVIVRMKDPNNADSPSVDMSLTKLGELQDKSSLFQVSGTTNAEMLKSLTGTAKQEDLTKMSVMMIVPTTGFESGKPMTVKLLKNVDPTGKDYVSRTMVDAIVPGADVDKAEAPKATA